MKRLFLLLTLTWTLTLTLTFSLLPTLASAQSELRVEVPSVVLAGVPFTITVQPVTAEGGLIPGYDGQLSVTGLTEGSFDGLSIARAVVGTTGRHTVRVQDATLTAEVEVRAIPAFFSILPPLIAIVFALLFRQVIVLLIAGIWLAATFIADYNIVVGFSTSSRNTSSTPLPRRARPKFSSLASCSAEWSESSPKTAARGASPTWLHVSQKAPKEASSPSWSWRSSCSSTTMPTCSSVAT